MASYIAGEGPFSGAGGQARRLLRPIRGTHNRERPSRAASRALSSRSRPLRGLTSETLADLQRDQRDPSSVAVQGILLNRDLPECLGEWTVYLSIAAPSGSLLKGKR